MIPARLPASRSTTSARASAPSRRFAVASGLRSSSPRTTRKRRRREREAQARSIALGRARTGWCAVSPTREPTAEQREAIASRGSDVLLEAGAGTGKTGVLVDRYCDLVVDDDIGPDRILAFTFTDKAAAQLRERVRDELHRRRAAGAAGSERLDQLLSSFGGAQITTIHGFCRRLLASHPVAAGIDPRLRVLDAAEAARAAEAAFDAAMVDFLADGDPGREITAAAFWVNGLRSMVVGAYEELRSRGQADPELPDPPPVDLGAAVVALEAAATEALAAPGGSAAQRAKIERALALCADSDSGPPTLDQLAVLDLGNAKGARGECAKALKAAIAAAAAEEDGGVVYAHLRELLRLFGRRFEAEKAARSGLDFEDLQLLAVRLLTESEVGETYRERFSHLMVDEFQDTNRLQLKLIEALRGPATELFLVGDEFQSIYGFRHADLEVFREQRRHFGGARGARVLPLSGNFRSRPEVVATANSIGAAMLEDFRPLTVGSAPDPEGPRGAGAAVELLLTERKGWDAEGIELDLPVDDRTPSESVAEARFLAARLRELTDERRPRRGHRRPAARLHPCRRLRGGAGAGRPPPLRGRRPRLLVPAAGRGRALPARDGRQPPRRRAAARRARLAGLRRAARHALDPAPGDGPQRPHLARCRARRRRLGGGPRGARLARADPAARPRAPAPVPCSDRRAAWPRFAALARGADRAGRRRQRLRPGDPDPRAGRAAAREPSQADADGARVRGQRGPRPARLSSTTSPFAAATRRRRWRRPRRRTTTGCG